MDVAANEVGTQEDGFNEGARIKEYQASTRAAARTPYCASGIHWCFRQCGVVIEPHWEFAAAARWAKENEVFRKGQLDLYETSAPDGRISMDADVFTLYYAKLGRVGHVGMICGEDEDYLITYEFNTSPGGSREGEGVFKRMRLKESVWTVNRWWEKHEGPVLASRLPPALR